MRPVFACVSAPRVEPWRSDRQDEKKRRSFFFKFCSSFKFFVYFLVFFLRKIGRWRGGGIYIFLKSRELGGGRDLFSFASQVPPFFFTQPTLAFFFLYSLSLLWPSFWGNWVSEHLELHDSLDHERVSQKIKIVVHSLACSWCQLLDARETSFLFVCVERISISIHVNVVEMKSSRKHYYSHLRKLCWIPKLINAMHWGHGTLFYIGDALHFWMQM